jgi:hypothetical protein
MELGEHRFLSSWRIRSGLGMRWSIFVDDFDALMDHIALRGVEPAKRGTSSNGVRKATYRDSDGNEIGYGGPALDGAVT